MSPFGLSSPFQPLYLRDERFLHPSSGYRPVPEHVVADEFVHVEGPVVVVAQLARPHALHSDVRRAARAF